MRKIIILLILVFIWIMGYSQAPKNFAATNKKVILQLVQKDTVISVFRKNGKDPILTQVSKADNRPYIHPLMAPDGKGVLTQYRPYHHLHQTGIYWGLKLVNGRDFFMNWRGDYYKRVSAKVITGKGQQVKWQTVYDLSDEKGVNCLTETYNWTMQERNGQFLLDLEYRGEAKTDITFGKFYVGGLFVRMPWHKGIEGDIVNAVGQHNTEAEAQRAIWADVGMAIEGRDDMGHIMIFDNPGNKAFPTPWRTDSQLGLGPSRQIMGDWKLGKGETEVIRYRLVVYTGSLTSDQITREWVQYVKEF